MHVYRPDELLYRPDDIKSSSQGTYIPLIGARDIFRDLKHIFHINNQFPSISNR